MNNNRCIACGAIIPEGLQVCPNCEKATANQIEEIKNDLFKFTYGVNELTLTDRLTDNTVATLGEYLVKEKNYRKVEQGRWLPIWDDCSLLKCSACGYEYMDKIECSNYCGNCGAKMKGN